MISATGRIPCIAAPIAAPASAISEIGVLRIRSGPNSATSPWVTPIDPPISAMSSPMTNTLSSLRIAAASASRTPSRYEISGIDVLERVLGPGVGARLCELYGALDGLVHLALDRLDVLVGELEPPAQLGDRVVVLAGVGDLVLRPVHL